MHMSNIITISSYLVKGTAVTHSKSICHLIVFPEFPRPLSQYSNFFEFLKIGAFMTDISINLSSIVERTAAAHSRDRCYGIMCSELLRASSQCFVLFQDFGNRGFGDLYCHYSTGLVRVRRGKSQLDHGNQWYNPWECAAFKSSFQLENARFFKKGLP